MSLWHRVCFDGTGGRLSDAEAVSMGHIDVSVTSDTGCEAGRLPLEWKEATAPCIRTLGSTSPVISATTAQLLAARFNYIAIEAARLRGSVSA